MSSHPLDGGPPAQRQNRQPGREHRMNPAPDHEPRFPGSGRLEGKSCLVTGGDSGIGRAVCVLFAREGADIAFAYLEEESDAAETVKLIEAEGARALKIKGDLGKEAMCERAVKETVEAFGGLDVLVNNCAEQHVTEALEDLSFEQMERTFRSNIYSYIMTTKHALKHMEDGAVIVNTLSVTAYKGHPVLVDYAATRGAALAFTRSLAKQLAERSIRVNGVAPGPIWTPLIPASFSRDDVSDFGADTLMGRPGEPNEVAACHLFLASADSSYMTGQVLHPNGGTMVGS